MIELMIVIAIVAILVALAVPAYQDYTIRAKVAECINGAAVAKLQISEYRETVGSFPADANEAGTATPGGQTAEYCDGWTYPGLSGDGSFDVLVNEANVDTSITGDIEPNLRGAVNASGGVDWECNQGGTDAANIKYLPSTCRGT